MDPDWRETSLEYRVTDNIHSYVEHQCDAVLTILTSFISEKPLTKILTKIRVAASKHTIAR